MKMGGRERRLAMMTGVLLALLASVWLAGTVVGAWREAAGTEKKIRDRLMLARKVLSQRESVVAQLDAIQRKLPRYGLDRDVTAEQMRMLDRIAQEQKFDLGQREPQMANTNGTVREIAIHSAYESDVGALVRFLYALQTQDVTFDVRRLTVSPLPGTAERLKGSLVIHSAYAVSDEVDVVNTPAQPVMTTDGKP